MTSATGIELGPDSCVLVGVRTAAGGPAVTAFRCLPPSDWPAHDVAVTEILRSLRQKGNFPRRARVVGWGLADGAKADDPMVQAALRPLADAGFRIEAILSPVEALARLAVSRRRTSEHAVAWLALNTFGAAIVILRGSELLFSRSFEWSFRPHAQPGARSELLQRYSLVAHLAPELQRGMSMVRQAHGVTVDTVVTCGDLPDLRSLTMPLIEELDLEVETLDSADGLRAGKGVSQEQLAERAPAIRLAYAAATATQDGRRTAPLLTAAAAVLLMSLLGLAAFGYFFASRSQDTAASGASASPAPGPRGEQAKASPRGSNSSGPTPAPAPAITSPQQNPAGAADTSSRAATRGEPQPTVGVPPTPQAPRVERPVPPAGLGVDQVARNREDNRVVPRPEGTQGVRSPLPVPVRTATKRPTPLKEPLPVIDSILVDAARRLAVVQGQVVVVGDVVGSRTVTEIERDFVVLAEPSGLTVRVKLRR